MIPVSVIIPFYKHIDELKRALASVESQTALPMEVIVVNDDGNNDNKSELDLLENQYSILSFKLIHLPKNIGAAGARNAGWDCASGDYVAFLDADDAWHPRKLEIQYEFMKCNPHIDLTGHGYFISSGEPRWDLNPSLPLSFSTITLNRLLIVNQFVTPSVMIKSSYPLRFNVSQRYMEDYQLWLSMAVKKAKMIFLNLELTSLFKPAFGAAGLSSHLWEMEKGELHTYRYICKGNFFLQSLLPILWLYSITKYVRRIMIAFVKNLQRQIELNK